MSIKIIGAIFILVGCSCFAFLFTAMQKKETRYLREYISALEFMECELSCRLTPLPELCNLTADVCSGGLKKLFSELSNELNNQITPDADRCMLAAIESLGELPRLTKNALLHLGPILGRFDLEGQCKELESLRNEAKRVLEGYSENQDTRIRSYQTLCICAGAAIVILFI